MEQLGTNAPRTAVGEQHATGLQNFEGQAVDVFVRPRRTVGMRRRGCELGRVEHDGVKRAPVFVKLAQRAVDVGIHHGGAFGIKAIERHIGTCAFNGRTRGVDGGDMRRTPRQSCHGEAAGVAVAVEHALKLQTAGVVGKLLAAVALVQVKACFVALGDIERELPVVFTQDDGGGPFASQPAGDGL